MNWGQQIQPISHLWQKEQLPLSPAFSKCQVSILGPHPTTSRTSMIREMSSVLTAERQLLLPYPNFCRKSRALLILISFSFFSFIAWCFLHLPAQWKRSQDGVFALEHLAFFTGWKTVFAAYYSYLLLARSSNFLLEVFPRQIINNFGKLIVKPKLEAKLFSVKSWI